MIEMLIICNRITKNKKNIVLRIKYKMSKRNFTNYMGCNNNKIATLKILWLFLYSTNTYESIILFIYKRNAGIFHYQFSSYQHQEVWQQWWAK